MLKFLFMFTLVFSSIYSLTNENWLTLWMSLEINMMSFIPLIINKFKFKVNSINLIKYFMIQSISSMIFFSSSIMSILLLNKKIFMLIFMWMNFSMFMKLGMFPFFLWYINLMKNLTWINCIILSIWQKIIPLYIILNSIKLIELNLFYLLIILNSFFSSINGLNQSNLKILMGYSSMNHMSWIMLNMFINEKMSIKYFFTYSFISMKIMYLFKILKMINLNQIYFNNLNKFTKILLMINMLSLGGIPPLMGFMMKWYSLLFMINSNYKLMFSLLLMLMFSIIILFYYIQLFTPTLIMYNDQLKFKNFKKLKFNNFLMMNLIFCSLSFLMFNYLIF